jgi:hypothetical protein
MEGLKLSAVVSLRSEYCFMFCMYKNDFSFLRWHVKLVKLSQQRNLRQKNHRILYSPERYNVRCASLTTKGNIICHPWNNRTNKLLKEKFEILDVILSQVPYASCGSVVVVIIDVGLGKQIQVVRFLKTARGSSLISKPRPALGTTQTVT